MKTDILFRTVGKVINDFGPDAKMHDIKKSPSSLYIFREYRSALFNINKCEYVDVIFYFHHFDDENVSLAGMTHAGDHRGAFASRSPHRPNLVGVTTVRVKEIGDEGLIVEGLDALNGSPIFDIKCADTSLFSETADTHPVHLATIKQMPRADIRNLIMQKKNDILLTRVGQMHGHYCPGLAMGVMAASYAMYERGYDSNGMEDLLAITETNNCFSDGVQYVTGCTLGNNALIYKDLGKTAFTLAKRNGKGLRVCSRPESQQLIKDAFPEWQDLYQQVVVEQNHDEDLVNRFKELGLERAFGTLKIPFEQLFAIKEITVDIPPYASIHKSVVCKLCGESVMENHTIVNGADHYCYECAKIDYMVVDGNGIHRHG